MRYRKFLLSYLFLAPLFCGVVVLASILLIRYGDPGLTDIRHHGLGYNTLAHHRFTSNSGDGDVVLIGDSSLLMGVVPEVLEQRLQRKVINLSLYATSGLQSYRLLLDSYLQRNRKPECVVFYFLPSTPYHFGEHSYEKTYTLLKYGDLWGALSHPDQVNIADCARVAWGMGTALSKNALHLSRARSVFKGDLAAMDATKGFVKNGYGTSLPQEFRFSTKQERELDLAFIEELKRHYQALGIRVLYYVSPMAQGDAGFPFFARAYRNVDNTMMTLPNRYFADQRHLTESGARYNSELFAGYLAGKLSQQQVRTGTGQGRAPLAASK